ncbi:structural constituent of cuticle [Exophiala oligosperma]
MVTNPRDRCLWNEQDSSLSQGDTTTLQLEDEGGVSHLETSSRDLDIAMLDSPIRKQVMLQIDNGEGVSQLESLPRDLSISILNAPIYNKTILQIHNGGISQSETSTRDLDVSTLDAPIREQAMLQIDNGEGVSQSDISHFKPRDSLNQDVSVTKPTENEDYDMEGPASVASSQSFQSFDEAINYTPDNWEPKSKLIMSPELRTEENTVSIKKAKRAPFQNRANTAIHAGQGRSYVRKAKPTDDTSLIEPLEKSSEAVLIPSKREKRRKQAVEPHTDSDEELPHKEPRQINVGQESSRFGAAPVHFDVWFKKEWKSLDRKVPYGEAEAKARIYLGRYRDFQLFDLNGSQLTAESCFDAVQKTDNTIYLGTAEIMRDHAPEL